MKGIGGHHSQRADTVVWLTPPGILSALGPFDLDPCAAPEPRPWPTARKHIGLPQDGLDATWKGRVWCNPPYGREVGRWLRKLSQHGTGTALVFARIETEWFTPWVWQAAHAVLFIKGRLHFHYPDGSRAANNAGGPSVLIAYGTDDAERLRASGIEGQFIPLKREVAA